MVEYCAGDSNLEQAHRRMAVSVNVMGEQSFTMVVQGRDSVQSVQQVVEARTGVAIWQQRVTYSGKQHCIYPHPHPHPIEMINHLSLVQSLRVGSRERVCPSVRRVWYE